MNQNKELIVAYHSENLDWIESVSADYKVTIYAKGELALPGMKRLPNIGREAHTYLTHIVDNYEDVFPVSVFTQGWPLDHNPNFVNDLNELSDNIQFQRLAQFPIVYDNQCAPHLVDTDYKAFYLALFNHNPPPLQFTYANAIFAVSKAKIQSKPKAFYEKCLALIPSVLSPLEGHYMERLWANMFGLHEVPSIEQLILINKTLAKHYENNLTNPYRR